MSSYLILGFILLVAFIGKAKTVAIATAVLLGVKLLGTRLPGLDRAVFSQIKEKGMTIGLIILSAAILIPFADGSTQIADIRRVMLSPVGITVMLISFLVTFLSGQGFRYLTVAGNAEIMPAIIVGAVIAAAFFGGVPVGPLVVSGMLVFVLKFVGLFAR
jgi:uncharacterized membrane protein (DUF441 family)